VQWKGRDKFVAIFDRYLGVARNTDGTLPGYFTNGENPEGAAQQLGWFALSTCYEMRTCPKSLMAKFANMSVGFGARVESLAVGGGEGLGVGLGRLGGSGGAAGEGVGGPCSFSPDTQVLLKDGKSKPIGKIKVGDKVQAANPKTGKHQGSRAVQHVWINHDHDLLDLTIRTKNGHTATLHTTTNHPFWDDTTHTWVPAGKLHHGDALNTATNGHAYVVATHPTPGAANRWNLTVQHLHTYYVLAGDTPVLVHNSGCGPGHVVGKGDDPLVPELVDEINARYPGHVRAQGVDIVGADGQVLTDFDIVTRNAVVQVKTGSGKGALKQALRTQELTGYPVIVYLPQGRGSVIKSLEQAGIMVTRDKNVLLDVLAPAP
jgi:hypothetical protein